MKKKRVDVVFNLDENTLSGKEEGKAEKVVLCCEK